MALLLCDKTLVGLHDSFLSNAAIILETAEAVARSGHAPSDCTILLGCGGELSIVMEGGWNLESLQADRGAQTAYKVSHTDTAVRVEGRAGSRSCLLETTTPNGVARLLLADRREYQLAGCAASPQRSGANGCDLPCAGSTRSSAATAGLLPPHPYC